MGEFGRIFIAGLLIALVAVCLTNLEHTLRLEKQLDSLCKKIGENEHSKDVKDTAEKRESLRVTKLKMEEKGRCKYCDGYGHIPPHK